MDAPEAKKEADAPEAKKEADAPEAKKEADAPEAKKKADAPEAKKKADALFGFLTDPKLKIEVNKQRVVNGHKAINKAHSLKVQINSQIVTPTLGRVDTPFLRELYYIKKIPLLNFTNLDELNLASTLLQSVQPLQTLMMPHLTKLNLNQNFITNFKSLRKLQCPQLRQILLYPEKLAAFQLCGRVPIKYLHPNYLENFKLVSNFNEMHFNQLQQIFLPLVTISNSQKSILSVRIVAKQMAKWNFPKIRTLIFAQFQRQQGESGAITYRQLNIKGQFFESDFHTSLPSLPQKKLRHKFVRLESIWENM